MDLWVHKDLKNGKIILNMIEIENNIMQEYVRCIWVNRTDKMQLFEWWNKITNNNNLI